MPNIMLLSLRSKYTCVVCSQIVYGNETLLAVSWLLDIFDKT